MRLTRFSFDVVRVNAMNPLRIEAAREKKEEEKPFGMILTYFANRIEPHSTKSVNAVRDFSDCTHNEFEFP